MTQRAKGKRGAPAHSRHDRDLVLLQRSRAASAAPAPRNPVAAPDPTADRTAPPPRQLVLNWQAGPNEPLLIVRPLQPDELPAVHDPVLRTLIDTTAQGLPLSRPLHEALLQYEPAALQAAIIAGIHRWSAVADG